ncbi:MULTISPECIES: VOC family protein [unclassified Streptomyces]|uniref:VOC family protein n=1 Tax=unclassified Streptomyces TaxID=2593676 RepID=UPI0038186428
MAGDGAAPAICPTLRYKDARAALAFLQDAFGFTQVAVHEGGDGTVQHAELAYGNGLVMLGSTQSGSAFSRVAGHLGPVSVYVVVADADAHHARAVAAGAQIVLPLTDQDYGSRDYTARDPEGNLWSFGTYAPRIPARG